MQFRAIKLTVFVKEGEEENVIAERLRALIPFEIKILRETATSAEDKPIIILSVPLEKAKQSFAFAEWLTQTLTPEQKQLLNAQAVTRLDQGLNFFIRFDKPTWLDGKLVITDSGNCFHCKMSLAAYPAKWEKGLAMVREILR